MHILLQGNRIVDWSARSHDGAMAGVAICAVGTQFDSRYRRSEFRRHSSPSSMDRPGMGRLAGTRGTSCR